MGHLGIPSSSGMFIPKDASNVPSFLASTVSVPPKRAKSSKAWPWSCSELVPEEGHSVTMYKK